MKGLHINTNGTVSWNGEVMAIDAEFAAHLKELQETAKQAKSWSEMVSSTNETNQSLCKRLKELELELKLANEAIDRFQLEKS